MTQHERLLRECIRSILSEDYGSLGVGGDYSAFVNAAGGMGMGHGAYGVHFGDANAMYRTFIKPFADVIGVVKGNVKELSQRALTVVHVAFESLATTLIPFLRDDYAEIFEKEKEQISRIREEYADVFNATWEAFDEMDVLIPAFMFRPDLFLTAQFVRRAPAAASKILSVLSGGALDNVLKNFTMGPSKGTKHRSSGKSKSPSEFFSNGGGPSYMDYGYGAGHTGMGFGFHESLERVDELRVDPKVKRLMQIIKNEKVKRMLQQSPKVQKMSEQGRSLVQGTLKTVFEHASAVLSADDLHELQQKLGKQIKGLSEVEKLPAQERKVAEAQLMKAVKASMKEFYVKQLTAQASSAVKAGVPREHPFVQDYTSVISKIKNL